MARDESKLLYLGDRIDLYLGKGPVYKTKLEDVTEDGNLLVSLPTHKGIPIALKINQGLQLYFYRENVGRYRVNVKMVGLQGADNLKMLELLVLSEPQKQQRRDSYRFPVGLKVELRPVEAGNFPDKPSPDDADIQETVTSINISATGIALKTSKEYLPASKLYLRIYLKWPKDDTPPICLLGEIRQFERLENDKKHFYAGVMFNDLTADMHSHISRYVLLEEQKQLRQRRRG